MRSIWKLAAWNSPPWEDEPEPDTVEGVATGTIEDIEVPEMPGLIFEVEYTIPYEYQFEDGYHEEEITFGSPTVVKATYITADSPSAKPMPANRRALEILTRHIDDPSLRDAFEEDVRADVEGSHSPRGRWGDEDDRRYDD